MLFIWKAKLKKRLIYLPFTDSLPKRMLGSGQAQPRSSMYVFHTEAGIQLKIWNTSRVCVSSLHRGRANLFCLVPTSVYVWLKWVQKQGLNHMTIFCCFSGNFSRELDRKWNSQDNDLWPYGEWHRRQLKTLCQNISPTLILVFIITHQEMSFFYKRLIHWCERQCDTQEERGFPSAASLLICLQ